MKNKVKRILAIALTFCLVLSTSQVSSYAEVLTDSDLLETGALEETEENDDDAASEMPAVTLTEQSGDVTVTVEAPEGAFPEGVTMTVETVADTDVFLDAVAEQDFAQYDETYTILDSAIREISFYVDGEKIQPETEVKVTFSGLSLATESELLKADYALVYHMDDAGNVEYIEDDQGQEPGQDSYSFTASDFSSYGVVNVNVDYGISVAATETVENAEDTITYSYTTQGGMGQSGTTTTASISVHFVDSSGNALTSAAITATDLPDSFSGTVTLSTLAGYYTVETDDTAYSYSSATVYTSDSFSSSYEALYFRYNNNSWQYSNSSNNNNNNWSTIRNGSITDIYLVYTDSSSSGSSTYSGYTVDHIDLAIYPTATLTINGKTLTATITLTNDDFYNSDGTSTGTWSLTAADSSGNSYDYTVKSMDTSGSEDSSGNAQVRFNGTFPIGTYGGGEIYYTFTFTTSVTFTDEDTNESYTVEMTFDNTFTYYNTENVCPGLDGNWDGTTYGGSASGMDFTISAELGGGSVSIVKQVRDAVTGELLDLTEEETFTITLYDATLNDGDTSNDEVEQTASLKVSDGIATVLYNLSAGDYYVVESSPAASVTTADGDLAYVRTETYYVSTTYNTSGVETGSTTSSSVESLTSGKTEVDSYTSVVFYVVNYYGDETVDVPVEKVWEDEYDYYGLRPDDVTVYLYADGKLVTEDDGETPVSLTLSESNSWEGKFEGLSKYNDNNEEITYTVAEAGNLPSAYTSTVTGSMTDGYTITNTLETASLTLNKVVKADSSIVDTSDMTFTFTVTGTNGELANLQSVSDSNETSWSVSGGVATVTVPADGSVTLVDLPVGTYTVAETGNTTVTASRYQYQWKVTGGGDVEVTTDNNAESTITNTITGTARLILYKYWEDQSNAYSTRPENDGVEFAVTITANNDTDGNSYTYTTTAAWDENGNTWTLVFDGVAAFDENGVALTYEITESGTYDLSAYTLSGDETVTPAADRNVELTNTLKTTTVTVEKVVVDKDGNKVSDADNDDDFRFALYTYVDEDGDGIAETAVPIGTSTIGADQTATFYNVPLGTVYLTEYLVGSHVHSYTTTVNVSGDGVSNVSDVSERYAYDDTEEASVKYHTVSFDVDESGAEVSVTVTNWEEELSVSLAALVKGTKTLDSDDETTKTFSYTVNQSLENPNADEDDEPLVATGTVTVSNGETEDIAWTILQESAFTYTEVGTYTYVIYEDEKTGTGSGGVVYDSTRYTLTVVVSKDTTTGELIATVSMTKSVENSDGTRTVTYVTSDVDGLTSFVADSTDEDFELADSFTASFVNIYDTTEASIILRATKTLRGRSLATGEFAIEIQQLDEDGNAIGSPVYRSNGVTGAFGYEITFTEKGTYYYKVSEVAGTLGGVSYDSHYYIVTIVVDDEDGVLTVTETETTYYQSSGVPALGSKATYESMVFINQYKTEDSEVTLSAYKVLDGRDFNDDDEFTFMIEALDSSAPFVDEEEYDVQTNSSGNRYITVIVTGAQLKALNSYYKNSDSTIALSLVDLITIALDQDDVGSWEYRVTEVAPDGATQNSDGTWTLEDLTYDTQTYGHLITLVVTDNGDGTLSTKTTSTNDTDWNGDGETDTTSAVIVNTFSQGIVNIYGRKVWVDGGLSHTDNDSVVELVLYYTTDTTNDASLRTWKEYEGSYTVNWGTLYTNDWDILNLPQYDSAGNEITYKVRELTISGYVTTYSNGSTIYDTDTYSSSDRFIITNTLEQDYVTLTGTKTWVDGGLSHTNADEITLTVSRNSETTSLTTLTQVDYPGTGAADTYIVVWDNDTYSIYWYYDEDEAEYAGLPMYDDSRYEYYYSVAETLNTDELDYDYTSALEMDVDNYTFDFTNIRASEDPEASKTETSINDESAGTGKDAVVNGKNVTQYDGVSVGDEITYTIRYYNGYNTEAQITITDVLDAGVAFKDATDPDSWTDTENHSYTEADGTVTWTFMAQPFESGTVTLTVTVTEAAKTITSTETTATVDNQATVVVADNTINTEIVSNPLEDEVQGDPEKELWSVSDSDGVSQTETDAETEEDGNLYVSVGDLVVYRISYANASSTTQTIYIVDTLDEGVTFYGANRSGQYYENGTTLTIDGTEVEVPVRSVVWTLTVQPYGSGYVRLYVTVNESALNASQTYTAVDPETGGEYTAYAYTTTASIANQAYTYVGNTTALYTDVIENPLEEEDPAYPVKTETYISGADTVTGTVDGEALTDETTIDENTTITYNTVKISGIIEYDITYYNNTTANATITITDTLDPGVTYVDATGDNGEVEGMTTTYDEDTRTVKWVITNVTPLSGGSVKLQVQVTHDAIVEGAEENTVENQATVYINDYEQQTNTVENPVEDDPADPIKVVADDSAAGVDGANVKAGDLITYEITYYNHNSTEAQITITDTLDENVEFVDATNPDSWTDTDSNSWTIRTMGLLGAGDTIVTWTFTADAYEVGTVTVTVRVLDDAVDAEKVINNASVQIGNDDIVDVDPVENPVDDDPEDPVKTETAIKDAVTEESTVPTGKVDGAALTDDTVIDENTTITYDEVAVGDEITYTISYYNHYGTPADITITDILDTGVDYVSAEGTYTQVTVIDGVETETEVSADVTKSTVGTTDKVTWELTNVKAYYSGTVTLTVRVNSSAETITSDEEHATVENEATVTVGEVKNNTNVVVNPLEDDEHKESKTVDTDHDYNYEDDGATVKVGDQIHYQIHYYNHTNSIADVTITDDLDEGVDFVVAFNENGEAETKGYNSADHSYTWTIENVAPFTEGTVTLVVQVNDKAMTYEDGETDGNGDAAAVVTNEATVKVGEVENTTNQVVNPLEDDDPENPVKTETAISGVDADDLVGTVNGEALTGDTNPDENTTVVYNGVSVNDEITYEISYYNHLNETATVKITDVLDEGVDYVEATGDQGEVEGMTTTYDEATRTVTWVIENVSPLTTGSVTLTVKVNENAKLTENVGDTASVENQATVTVGEVVNDTNYVVNPLEPDDPKQPTKTISEMSPSGYDKDAEIVYVDDNDPGTLTGSSVGVGSIIAYTISYYNYTNEKVVITITDELDPGVDFLSASDGGVYDEGTHTVTWTLTVEALTSDTVTLNVQVNENAKTIDGDETQATVDNQATVTIAENVYDTNLVTNPIDPEDPGDPEKAVSADSEAGVEGAHVSVGDQITYEIGYYNHTNETATVTITDELQTGLEYISSTYKGTCTDGVVTWTIEDVAPYTGGTVTLTVMVTADALEVTQVENDAVVKVGDNEATTNLVTNPVDDEEENPVKTETAITDAETEESIEPVGTVDGKTLTADTLIDEDTAITYDEVAVGDKITYTISYYNHYGTPADITITDVLDAGVEYVSHGSVTYTQVDETNGKETVTNADVNVDTEGTATTVTWSMTNVKAYEGGTVTLTVRVADDAKTIEEDETQATVENQATVTVGEVKNITNLTVNPLEEEDRDDSKTVDTDLDGVYEDDNEAVKVGDQISYQIHFYNNTNTTADIVITDALDEGVDFVTAYDENDVEVTDGYGEANHTYTWTIEKVAPFTGGDVTLVVEVNEKAVIYEEGEVNGDGDAAAVVKNQAIVKVGDITNETNWVINPLEDDDEENPVKSETSITDAETGESTVPTGTVYGLALTEDTELDEDTVVTYDGVSVGDEITYEISYYNHLNSVSEVTVIDELDEGVDFVSATDENGNVVTSGYNEVNHTYTWNIADVAPLSGGSVTLTVRVNDNAKLTENVGDEATVENQATVTVGEVEHDTNYVVNPLEPDDPEEPTKTISASSASGYDEDAVIEYDAEDAEDPGTLTGSSVGVGSIISYTIEYYNYTNEKAVITITDKLDEGVDFLSASDGFVYDDETHTVTWELTVEALTDGTVTLNVQVNKNAKTIDADETQATVDNQATVIIAENEYDTNLVTNPIDPDDPGDPEKAVSADSAAGVDGASVSVGDQIIYEISYYNYTNETADVIITDELQTGVNYISSSDDGTESAGVVTWTIGDVAPYTGGIVTVTVEVTEDALDVTQVENDAVVQVGDHVATTNLVTNPVDDDPEDPVKSVDAGNGTEVSVGDTLVYTITWYNHLSSDADVVITDILDEGLTFVSASDNGTYDEDSRTVTWTIEDVDAYTEGSVTLTVTVNSSAGSSVDNTAKVSIGGNTALSTNTVTNPVTVTTVTTSKTTSTSGTQTGDIGRFYLWLLLLFASGAGLCFLGFYGRKRGHIRVKR